MSIWGGRNSRTDEIKLLDAASASQRGKSRRRIDGKLFIISRQDGWIRTLVP